MHQMKVNAVAKVLLIDLVAVLCKEMGIFFGMYIFIIKNGKRKYYYLKFRLENLFSFYHTFTTLNFEAFK
uniref:Putative secreted protein n=1 Tax=Panstrongylus lignarius TaxID=156445 RepID=A0A224Y668_9HEMI